jgi:Holliday junction resolvase RusA-like endonuclease
MPDILTREQIDERLETGEHQAGEGTMEAGEMTLFEIPGPPVPKARHRYANGHEYVDPKTAAYENAVAMAAMAAHLELKPGHVAYSLTADFYISTRFWMVDLDNLIKGVMDGLGRYGKPYGWRDSQIVSFGRPRKHQCKKGEERTVVRVWEGLQWCYTGEKKPPRG